MARTTTTILTTDDLEAGYDRPDYEGFGYLGARSQCGRIARMQRADAALLKAANDAGWHRDWLGVFVTSKLGRWYGDEVFGADPDDATLAAIAAKYVGMAR